MYNSTMEDKYRDDFINHILYNFDVKLPPSDFGKNNILGEETEAVQTFKNCVVLPAFDAFLNESLNKSIKDWASYKIHSWITGTGRDYSINYHNHRGSQISAVFYLLCEEISSGGLITFTDPRQNSNRGYDERFEPWFDHFSIMPKSGDIVVFPSFLYHFVSSYQGNIRLAMPVDLFLHNNF